MARKKSASQMTSVEIAKEEANAEEAIPLAERVEEATPQGEAEFAYDASYFIDIYTEKNGHAYGHHEPWLSFFGHIGIVTEYV